MRRVFLLVLLISAFCLPSFGQIREIYDEASTAPAPSDSVLVIVDGIVSPVRFKNSALPPLELALQLCPFLSEEDIDTVRLINALEASSNTIPCYNPGDVLLITTHEECAIHDYFLDGKPVHKRKGIALSSLLDRERLLADIKKKWGVKPGRIKMLEVEGKTIRITTKSLPALVLHAQERNHENVLIEPNEQKPSFDGGDANMFKKWVDEHKIYPEEAKKAGIEGRVWTTKVNQGT